MKMPEEHNNELPSIEDIVGQIEELPSVDEFIELEEEKVEEETQIIDDAEGNAKIEVTDVIQAPEWGELLRLINDVRQSIPEIPEIKTYDKELEAICEIIDDVRDSIPVVPEVRYYEEELETIKESVQAVKDSIPTLPVWIEKVTEVPDFEWVGQTFNTIDERFRTVKDWIENVVTQAETELNRLQEEKDTLAFESKTDFKTVHDRVSSLKDQIYGQLKEQSDIIWKLQKKLKENQKEFEILTDEKLDVFQETTVEMVSKLEEKLIESTSTLGEKVDQTVFELDDRISSLPKPKYYEEELNKIRKDLKNFESLKEIVEQIQVRQEKVEDLQENYLLNEPPEEVEDIGSGQDPLTPMDQKFATLSDLASHYRIFINRIQTQLSTMGGGGAGFIKDLDDVDITGLADGYILQYNATDSKWETVANSGTGVGGTWFSNDVGVSTTRIVGIATTSAKAGVSLYVVGDAEITGNISVAGTITYDDVTNVDSLGIVTARTGIDVLAGGINAVGVVTATTFDGNLAFSNITGISTNIVGDTSPQLGGNLDLNSNNITGTGDIDFTGSLTVTSTDTGSSAAPELTLYRNSASPAPGDYLGQIMFKGENSNGGQENYAKITGKISDETLGTEDGLIETAIKGDGSFTIVSRQRSDQLQLINGVGLSVDGDSTFTGGIDVDGHTELDDVNVSGVITATSFVGDGTGLTGVASTDYIITGTAATFNNHVDFNNNIYQTGIATFGASNGIGTVTVGVGTTALLVDGDARIIGILTVGRGSVTIDGENNTVTTGIVTITNSEVILGDNVTINASATGINSAPNVLYVAKDGNDSNNGTSIDNAFLTIKAAAGIATTGTVIKVLAGNYTEDNPIQVPAFCAIVGDDQRTVTVVPNNATSDIFHVRKASKIANMTFTGHRAPAAAIAFPTADAAVNQGGGKWKGPYVQNCTSDTTTGTGARVDGNQAPLLKSMNFDSFTQYNQGGVGIAVTNEGYAQLVSIFTICCNEAITCDAGGQADVANSNCSFGTYGLVSRGVGIRTFTSAVAAATTTADQKEITISGLGTERPYDGQGVYFDQLYQTITSITLTNAGTGYTATPNVIIDLPTGPSGSAATAFATLDGDRIDTITLVSGGDQFASAPTITIDAPTSGTQATATASMEPIYYTVASSTETISGISTITLEENLNNAVSSGTTAYFHQLSRVVASSHTFEYIGSGNTIQSATPKRGGVTIQANEVFTDNGGRVVYTSTDQAGNFRIGDNLQINQSTGTISGRAFTRSLFSEMTPFILALS